MKRTRNQISHRVGCGEAAGPATSWDLGFGSRFLISNPNLISKWQFPSQELFRTCQRNFSNLWIVAVNPGFWMKAFYYFFEETPLWNVGLSLKTSTPVKFISVFPTSTLLSSSQPALMASSSWRFISPQYTLPKTGFYCYLSFETSPWSPPFIGLQREREWTGCDFRGLYWTVHPVSVHWTPIY